MRFLCLADIHGHDRNIPALLDEVKRQGVECIIISGDITHGGSDRDAKPIIDLFRGAGLPLFAVHGNMDRESVGRYLDECAVGIHGKTVEFRGATLTGLGGGNTSPFSTPTEYTEEEIADFLGRSDPDGFPAGIRILVSHVPPRNTSIDVVRNGTHVGSEEVRTFILAHGFNLCICGHIHEARGNDRVGECTCINTGSFREGDYCIVDIDEITKKTGITWGKAD
jgi:Icc-related predicted phosphoesterase